MLASRSKFCFRQVPCNLELIYIYPWIKMERVERPCVLHVIHKYFVGFKFSVVHCRGTVSS